MNRRDFLTSTGHILVGACTLSAVAGGIRLAVPDFALDLPERFPLGAPADFMMNTLTWLRDRDLFVMRNHQGVGVFSSRCTHLGCTVRRTGQGFSCPCHGAEYDFVGRVISGPARQPLPWYRVWLEADGRIWADLRDPLTDQGPRPLSFPDEVG